MEVKVLVERKDNNGYQARAGEPFGLVAEGASIEEAVGRLREVMTRKDEAGATVVSLDIPGNDNSWLRMAGTLKDHPLLDEWKLTVAEYRQSVENDPERL